jgi:hypothetical protein
MSRRSMLFLALNCVFLLTGIVSAAPREIMLTASPGATGPSLDLVSGASDGCQLRFALSTLAVEDVTAGGEAWQALTIEGGEVAGDVGEPALPTYSGFIAVPAGHTVTARATVHERRTVDGIHLLPVQPDQGEDFVVDRDAYAAPSTRAAEMVTLGAPAIMHGVQLVPFTIQPVSYDPQGGQVDVATDVDLAFTFTPGGGGAPLDFVAESFDRILEHVAVNWETVREVVATGPGTYLVVMPNNATVVANMQPLIEWRQRQGYNVIQVTTAQAGTTNAQIKAYIQNIYNTVTPRLEYVCLVGDANGSVAMPTWNESLSNYHGEGDHYYTTLQGGDVLSDCHIGRLSVQSTAELTTVVNKILGYERTPPVSPDPSWFHHGTLVGDRSSSGISTIFCQQWLRAQLESLGYNQLDTIYASPFASRMSTSANLGGTVFSYRGYIGVSGFSTGYIGALTNGAKLSFAVIPTCASGSFATSTTTYTEAFLRNANGGAVGSIGTATPGTHTRFNNCYFSGVWEGVLNTGARELGVGHTFGKLELYKNFAGTEINNVEIWSVWNNLMGDPATEMWQNVPSSLTVDYPALLPVGASAVPVTVTTSGEPVVGARVAATKGTEIRVVGYTDAGGHVTLQLPAGYTAGSLLVTVTGNDLLPHLGSLTLGAVDAFASLTSFQVNDSASGDGNGQANPAEGFALNLSLTNLGSQVAGAVSVALTSEDPSVTVVQGIVSFGDIASGATVARGPFLVEVAPGAADGLLARLRVTAISGSQSWVSLLELPIVAADPVVTASVWSENGGRALPGQIGNLQVTIRNDGSRNISAANLRLTSQSPFVLFAGTAESAVGAIPVGGTAVATFPLQISPVAFGGHLAALAVEVVTAEGSVHALETVLPIGTASTDSPCGPDHYGYLAFDNLDVSPLAPAYNWVEIDPTYGGQGTSVGLTDNAYEQDDTDVLPLPFTFRYYGRDFSNVAICSNGFISLGGSTLKPFHNLALPAANCPNSMIAVFWDDLMQSGTNKVYYWHDVAGSRYVVQWSRMRNDNNGQQNCEVILYDPAVYPTATGDGMIVMQFAQVSNNDTDRAYCTTGIQNFDSTDGITYTYYNRYAAGARTLAAGRAIAFVPTANVGADALTVQPVAITANLEPDAQVVVPVDLAAAGAAGTVLYYSLTAEPAGQWLTFTPGSGLVTAGSSATIAVTLDATGLSEGVHAGVLTVYSTAGTPIAVPVELLVGQATPVTDAVPQSLTLAPAYPNPFNPRTVLSFALPVAGPVQLVVHDLAGRRLAVLVDEVRAAGQHQVAWDGTDDTGRRLASGTYLARLVAGAESRTQKLVLVK